MATPSDPLFEYQWHFNLMGNIQTIWDEYDGTGVNVGVYDEGVDYTHEDLSANYDSSLHVVDDSGDAVDPIPIGDAAHGTACAGLIGAANNDVGGVGVAYGVTLTGVNIDFNLDGVYGSVNGELDPFLYVVWQAAANFDITSHSWGSTPEYYSGSGLLDDGFAASLNTTYGALLEEGRNGLGTIVVQAAGNDNLDGNGNGTNASRYTITVAAAESTGFAAWYSNFGTSILVTAPAAAYTTDISGESGYDSTDYTDSFNGTSAATPVVSGVIALMLHANTGLGWRDVQNILATSASLTGSEFDASESDAEEDGYWYSTSSGNWNGGGNHVHTNYGYGMVNAYNAVRMAEVWDLFSSAQTSANEQSATSAENSFDGEVVEDGGEDGFTTTFTIESDIQIEHLALTLDFEADWVGDLRIIMTSAAGTEFVVTEGSSSVGTEFDGTWVFGIDSLRGELSAGTWTMTIFDIAAEDALTVNSASLEVFGSTVSNDDVYHVTDEYAQMIGFDATRGTIYDEDGGDDWLNMAAVTGNVVINMTSGETFSFDDVVLGELSGDFENIVTGDGTDSITGTDAANELRGMRGDDTLNGEGGADTLNGGSGDDSLLGGAGDDTYVVTADDTITELDDAGDDTVRFSDSYTLGDNLENLTLTGSSAVDGTGNALDNTLTGNSAANTLSGGEGDDTYVVDASDSITEESESGTDTVRTSISFTLGSNLENLTLTGSSAVTATGNSLSNTLTGNRGANTLNGRTGTDILIGGAGDDIYMTDGGDTITEASGSVAGTDTVQSSITYTLGDNLENLTLLGSSAINGTGNALNNTLTGNRAANTLAGGLGNDIYVVDSTDTITEASGSGTGTDTVQSSGTYTLGANLENLTLTGSSRINGTGNTLNNTLTGNAAANTLDGSTGTDTLVGGNGSDTYVTDGGDTITESADAGTDTVQSTATATLAVNLENLTLIGSSAINGTGNTLNNTITGNSAANTLNGGTGTDILIGGAGNDIFVTDGGDTITESSGSGSGTDTVQSSVTLELSSNLENLTLTGTSAINGTGNTLNNILTGNSAANTLIGGAGADTLNGFTGKDLLTGDAGNDTFIFNNMVESPMTATTSDVITDFVRGQDKINLSAIDAFASSSTNDSFNWKGTAEFNSATQGEARFQLFDVAGTSNDYTMIWIDNDADKDVEMAIRLTGLYSSLSNSDFIL